MSIDPILDPTGLIRELLTPEAIVDSLIEAVEPFVDALQLNAKACLQVGLALGMAIPEAINTTLKAIEEDSK